MRKSSTLACNQCSLNGRNIAWAFLHLAGILLREQKRKTQKKRQPGGHAGESPTVTPSWEVQQYQTICIIGKDRALQDAVRKPLVWNETLVTGEVCTMTELARQEHQTGVRTNRKPGSEHSFR